MDEWDSSAKAEVAVSRAAPKKKHAFDDIIYMLMGEATLGNLVVMVFALLVFGSVPFAILAVSSAYSGGMRWLITLGLVAFMGAVAVYLMKRGVERAPGAGPARPAQREFPGELTTLTEAMGRASSGYAYSQQMMRERLCEAVLNKLHVSRDLDMEWMGSKLESGDAGFVGDPELARFLLQNRRGAKDWDEMRAGAKGGSAERGERFMLEFDEMLKRAEAMV